MEFVMSEEKTDKVKLNIFGTQINIKAPSGETARVEQLADYVNKQMLEVSEQFTTASMTKVAILVAINIADDLFSLREKDKKLNERLENVLKDRTEKIKNILKNKKK